MVTIKSFLLLVAVNCLCKAQSHSDNIRLCERNLDINCTGGNVVQFLRGTVYQPNWKCNTIDTIEQCDLENTTMLNIISHCELETSCSINSSIVRKDRCLTDSTDHKYIQIRIEHKCGSQKKTVTQFADRTFNLNKCRNRQTISITKIKFYQKTHLCQYCGDGRYCRDSNKDPIKIVSTLCNGRKTCQVQGQDFLNLSETCLGIRTYIQLAYNCTKEIKNLEITDNVPKKEDLNTAVVASGVIVGTLFVVVVSLISTYVIKKHRQTSRLKEDSTIIEQNEVSNRSSVYSFAPAEGLAEDPTGFTTNRSDYSYVETTPNQINSELNKSSHFLVKENMTTSSSIKINNGNSSMDVIDNELETSGNNVPNTSNNTQSERSMVSADDYDDTYKAQSDDVYDHTDDRRHKEVDTPIYSHTIDNVYDSANYTLSRDASSYDHVALSNLKHEYINVEVDSAKI